MAGKFWYTDKNGKRKRTAAGVKHEYERFQSSAKAIKDRDARNSARRSAIKSGIARVGDGKDIHHSDGNPRHNSPSNLKAMSRSANRGKREESRKRGSRRNKTEWGK